MLETDTENHVPVCDFRNDRLFEKSDPIISGPTNMERFILQAHKSHFCLSTRTIVDENQRDRVLELGLFGTRIRLRFT